MAAGAADSWYHEKESAWGAFRGGLRMVLIGGGAGVAAWGVGKLLGASLG